MKDTKCKACRELGSQKWLFCFHWLIPIHEFYAKLTSEDLLMSQIVGSLEIWVCCHLSGAVALCGARIWFVLFRSP